MSCAHDGHSRTDSAPRSDAAETCVPRPPTVSLSSLARKRTVPPMHAGRTPPDSHPHPPRKHDRRDDGSDSGAHEDRSPDTNAASATTTGSSADTRDVTPHNLSSPHSQPHARHTWDEPVPRSGRVCMPDIAAHTEPAQRLAMNSAQTITPAPSLPRRVHFAPPTLHSRVEPFPSSYSVCAVSPLTNTRCFDSEKAPSSAVSAAAAAATTTTMLGSISTRLTSALRQPRFRVVHPHGFRLLRDRSALERSLRHYFRLPNAPSAHTQVTHQRVRRVLRHAAYEAAAAAAAAHAANPGRLLDAATLLRAAGGVSCAAAVEAVSLPLAQLNGTAPAELRAFDRLGFADLSENALRLEELLPLRGLEVVHLTCNGMRSLRGLQKAMRRLCAARDAGAFCFGRGGCSRTGGEGLVGPDRRRSSEGATNEPIDAAGVDRGAITLAAAQGTAAATMEEEEEEEENEKRDWANRDGGSNGTAVHRVVHTHSDDATTADIMDRSSDGNRASRNHPGKHSAGSMDGDDDALFDEKFSDDLYFPHLRALNLSYNAIPAAELSLLGYLPRLTRLDLSGNNLRALPNDLAKLTHVTHLALEQNHFASAPGLFSSSCSSPLRSNARGGTPVDVFLALSTMPALVEVNLSHNQLSHVPALNAARPCIRPSSNLPTTAEPNEMGFPSLQVITLSDNAFVTAASVSALTALHRTLQRVVLARNPLCTRASEMRDTVTQFDRVCREDSKTGTWQGACTDEWANAVPRDDYRSVNTTRRKRTTTTTTTTTAAMLPVGSAEEHRHACAQNETKPLRPSLPQPKPPARPTSHTRQRPASGHQNPISRVGVDGPIDCPANAIAVIFDDAMPPPALVLPRATLVSIPCQREFMDIHHVARSHRQNTAARSKRRRRTQATGVGEDERGGCCRRVRDVRIVTQVPEQHRDCTSDAVLHDDVSSTSPSTPVTSFFLTETAVDAPAPAYRAAGVRNECAVRPLPHMEEPDGAAKGGCLFGRTIAVGDGGGSVCAAAAVTPAPVNVRAAMGELRAMLRRTLPPLPFQTTHRGQ